MRPGEREGSWACSTHLRFSPPSLTRCSSPLGRSCTYVFRWASSRAFQTSSSVYWSKGSRFIRRVPVKRTGSCQGQHRVQPCHGHSAGLNVAAVAAPGPQVWPQPAHPAACSWAGEVATACSQALRLSAAPRDVLRAMRHPGNRAWGGCAAVGHRKVGSAHLGDDGEVLAQVVEADRRYIHLVDDDRPSSGLQHPEEAVGEGGFSSPGPAHNANLWKQLFRPADRVEENRADALCLGLVGLPALHLQSPSPRPSPLVPAPQLESPGATSHHHPSPAH